MQGGSKTYGKDTTPSTRSLQPCVASGSRWQSGGIPPPGRRGDCCSNGGLGASAMPSRLSPRLQRWHILGYETGTCCKLIGCSRNRQTEHWMEVRTERGQRSGYRASPAMELLLELLWTHGRWPHRHGSPPAGPAGKLPSGFLAFSLCPSSSAK